VQRFQREAEAAAKLHHSNIVPVYATEAQGEIHYYAMELKAR
jgi:serine/threonine protein kinase